MNNVYDNLYSRDSTGKVLVWSIEVQNNGEQVDIKTSYGEYKGKKTLRWKRNVQGVNIGKSNETFPFEQACNEAESTIRRRKDSGYMTFDEVKELADKTGDNSELRPQKTSIEPDSDMVHSFLNIYLPHIKTDAAGLVKPMKCQQYYRSKKNWTDPTGEVWSDRKYYYMANPYVEKEDKAIIPTFPVIGQPKINGVRATIQLVNGEVKILSKQGKEYNIPQILDYFNMNIDMFEANGLDIVFDGELYIHGELLQDIASAVKKVSLMTQRVIFMLFDLAIPDVIQKQRWAALKEYKAEFDKSLNCPVQLIRAFGINNDNEAQVFTDKCIKEGYEGAIFRQFNNKYNFGGRPTTITKLKRAISKEFKIVDVIPQDVDPSLALYVCVNSKGLRFKVTPKGTEEFKRNIMLSPSDYIGKSLTVDFYEWTKDMKPFHILNNVIRDYE